jgi:hypothetical protein
VIQVSKVTDQFRIHPLIGEFIYSSFFEGTLNTALTTDAKFISSTDYFSTTMRKIAETHGPLLSYDGCFSKEEKVQAWFVNKKEAESIVAFLDRVHDIFTNKNPGRFPSIQILCA